MRVVVVALCLASLAAACGPTGDPCLEPDQEPAFDGNVTDDTWLTMKDVEPHATFDEASSPVFTAPADGAAVRAAPTFTWTSPLRVASLEPARKPARKAVRVPARGFIGGAADALFGALDPPALAHLPPKTGDMYLIEMPLSGRTCPLGVHTSNLQVTLDDAAWKELKDHKGEDITASIVGAYLVNNRVSEGPYKGNPVTFHVE